MTTTQHGVDNDWDTTPPHLWRSTLEPPNLMELVIYRLKQRSIKSAGVVSLVDGSVAHVFVCKGKVCTVMIFNKDRDEILQAFTTNSIGKNDNFDKNITATIAETAASFYLDRSDDISGDEESGEAWKEGYPLENGLFGAGKVLSALNSINELLYDSESTKTALDVLGVMFESAPSEYLAQCWYAASRGSTTISAHLGMRLMKKNLLSIYDSVIKLAVENHEKRAREIVERGSAKTPSLNDDPIIKTCILRVGALRAWSATNMASKDVEAWAEMFWQSMMNILEVIHLAHPKVAKMGVGRAVCFPCIDKPWKKYAVPMVALARRAALCADPVQLYTFCMSNESHEFSTGDDIWAHRIKPLKEGMGPLDAFLPKMVLDKSLDVKREEILALMRGNTNKLLGTANAMALDSIKCEVTGVGSHGLLADPEIIAYLRQIGWEEWFQAKMLSSAPFGLWDCAKMIDPMVADILRTTTKGDIEAFYHSLSEELE